MTSIPADVLALLTTGGPWGVLVALTVLWILGYLDLRPKATVTREEAAHAALVTEVSRDRDEWKAVAKQAVAEVAELGEALTVRNRIDEEIRKGLTKAGAT